MICMRVCWGLAVKEAQDVLRSTPFKKCDANHAYEVNLKQAIKCIANNRSILHFKYFLVLLTTNISQVWGKNSRIK